MEEILQIVGSLLLIVVYIIYLKQTMKGDSTPNPGTWIVWFIIMGINTVNYFKVVDDNYFKTAIVTIGFIGMTSIMLYSLFKGKFAKIAVLDIIILLLSLAIVAFWAISKNAKLSNLLLQLATFMSFFPTAIGVYRGKLKEKHLPWTIAVIAYTLQTTSLLINYDGNVYQLFLPIINGILGNGLIPIAMLIKK